MSYRVLLLTDNYLPGFKSGGPVRSVANLVESLHEYFEFYILTSDRDLGDPAPYPNIEYGVWHNVGHAMVRYLAPSEQSIVGMWRVISEIEHDLLYLNSFFSPRFTIAPLLGRRLGRLPSRPTLIAPRGQFSKGALSIKPTKKRVYLLFSRVIGLVSGLYWQASSYLEAKDIERELGIGNKRIFVANNLPTPPSPVLAAESKDVDDDVLELVFVSRISRKKNLVFLLDVLGRVNSHVRLNIYGPIEDVAYWEECKSIVKKLPENIEAVYQGTVDPREVSSIMRANDLFFMPTLGENYGHVIAESLSVGTPVLISDQTPWRNLEADGLGFDISLHNHSAFVEIIERFAQMSREEKLKVREQVQISMNRRWSINRDVEANQEMFMAAISQVSSGT